MHAHGGNQEDADLLHACAFAHTGTHAHTYMCMHTEAITHTCTHAHMHSRGEIALSWGDCTLVGRLHSRGEIALSWGRSRGRHAHTCTHTYMHTYACTHAYIHTHAHHQLPREEVELLEELLQVEGRVGLLAELLGDLPRHRALEYVQLRQCGKEVRTCQEVRTCPPACRADG